jgi:thiamine biosynthesis lipoprotein ApbE
VKVEEVLQAKTMAPTSIDAVEHIEKLMGQRSLISRIKKDQFNKFILHSDKFVELFNNLDTLTKQKAE